MAKQRAVVAVVVGWCLACGGSSLGEDRPGDNGTLDHATAPTTETPDQRDDGWCRWNGDLEVSTGVERAYVLTYEVAADCADAASYPTPTKTLWGWAPGDAAAQPLLDFTGLEDVRIDFTSEGLLLMAQTDVYGGVETLWTVDEETLEVKATKESSTWYWGTRTSASRRWVAVADNNDELYPLHVLDPATLDAAIIDTGAWWLEVQWAHQSDRLVGLVTDEHGRSWVRVWSFEDAGGLVSIGGSPSMPAVEWELELGTDLAPNLLFSYSWIAIAPQDQHYAFSMYRAGDGVSVVVVVDAQTGAAEVVPDVWGPVAFTPDGSSVVGWDDDGLVVIDTGTGRTRRIHVDTDWPTFFVSRDGADVLVADTLGDGSLTLFDLETGESTVLPVDGALSDFTYRDGHEDLWMIDEGEVSRIDLAMAEAETVDVPFVPERLNWLPGADLLVMDDAEQAELHFFDPDTRRVTATTSLVAPRSSPLRLAVR